MLKFSKQNNLKIRNVNLNDAVFLYKIYNQNISRGNFFSKKKLKFSDHKSWLQKKIKNKNIFICYRVHRIGYVRFDKFQKNCFKVSIAILDRYKRRGFGKSMFLYSLKKIKLKKFKVFAFIKNSNISSKKFFKSLNFEMYAKNSYIFKKS